MNRTAAALALCLAAHAFAGKPERDKQKEMTAKVAEPAKAVKAACGCDVKMSPKWDSYKKADDMFRIDYAAENFAAAAKAHCESAEDKKVFCANVSELVITFQADVADPDHKGKTITAHSNDMSANSDGQFKAILDKF